MSECHADDSVIRQLEENQEQYANLINKSFRFSRGNVEVQGKFILWLKQTGRCDLLAIGADCLMANQYIQDSLVEAFVKQHKGIKDIYAVSGLHYSEAQTEKSITSHVKGQIAIAFEYVRDLENRGVDFSNITNPRGLIGHE